MPSASSSTTHPPNTVLAVTTGWMCPVEMASVASAAGCQQQTTQQSCWTSQPAGAQQHMLLLVVEAAAAQTMLLGLLGVRAAVLAWVILAGQEQLAVVGVAVVVAARSMPTLVH